MNLWQWFQENTLTLFGGFILIFLLVRYRMPSAQAWGTFLDSFESKGAQILLLCAMDLIFVALVIKFGKNLEPGVLSTVTGILGGINGAFLGAMGARQPSNGGAKPDTLQVKLTPEGEKK